MEKKKRTIITIASVIALAMAILVCGVLLGCGEKPKGGEKGSTIEPVPLPNGVHLGAKIEEKEEYDIDDISLELLYGIDIDLFNSRGHGLSVKDENGNSVKRRLCLIAYNDMEYDIDHFEHHSPILFDSERERLYDDLSALEVGTANESAFLIDEIPFTIVECDKSYIEWLIQSPYDTTGEVYQYMSVDNLRGTEYECTSNENNEIIFHKKIDIKFPQELFTNDSGCIYVEIALMIEDNLNEARNAYVYGLSFYRDSAQFEYVKNDGKIVLTSSVLGLSHFVDGTNDTIETKTKTPSNTKLSVEEREIDTQETEYDIETQSDVLCSGVEGTINWVDRSGIPHPAQYIMVNVCYHVDYDLYLGTCYTDVNGHYSYDFFNNYEYEKICLFVYATGENVTVYNEKSWNYCINTVGIATPDYWNGRAQLSVNFDTTTEFGQALQISQAVITAERYATSMIGYALKPVEVYYYEGTGGCYYNRAEKIFIQKSNNSSLKSYESWDVIMHEYGHHVQACLGLTQSPNGAHSFSINSADHFYEDKLNNDCSQDWHTNYFDIKDCKIKGISLAWAEGWATVFGFMAQNFYSNDLTDIKTVNDAKYNSYNGAHYDAEGHNSSIKGEARETVVISLLWDLFDEYNNKEPFDKISLSHNEMWEYVVKPRAKTLSEFLNYISDKLPRDDLALLLDQYQINVGGLKFDFNDEMPRFSWNARGGSQHYPNNMFDLKVYDGQNNLLFAHDKIRAESYTVNYDELNKLLQHYGDFYWTVDAYQLDDDKGGTCMTGPFVGIKTKQSQIFEYMDSGNEITGEITEEYSCKYYKYVSNGYLNSTVTVKADDGFAVSCAVMPAPVSSASAKLRGSGNKVEIPYEFTTGGSTVFICVKSAGPYPKGFSLEIKNHRHVFGEWTSSEYSHSRSCACGQVESVAHTYTLLTHDDDTHTRRCTVCGYVTEQPHSLVGTPSGDEMICYSCGYRRKRY